MEEGCGQRSIFSALLCDGDRERCLMAISRCGGPAGAGDEAAATLMDGDQYLGRCCRSKSPQWLRHADRLSSSWRAVVGVGDLSALVTIQRPGFSLDRLVMLVEKRFLLKKVITVDMSERCTRARWQYRGAKFMTWHHSSMQPQQRGHISLQLRCATKRPLRIMHLQRSPPKEGIICQSRYPGVKFHRAHHVMQRSNKMRLVSAKG